MAIDERTRQKALTLVRRVLAARTAWEEAADAGRGPRRQLLIMNRLVRAANKVEPVLFRIACSDLDDVRARIAYGEIAGLRSAVHATTGGTRLETNAAIRAARASMWGLFGAELAGGATDRMERLAAEPSIETDYTEDGSIGVLDGEARLATAADARFVLAERLLRANRPQPKEPMTPQQLDATFLARDKFYSTDATLLWTCQLASCRSYDLTEEAELLAVEATAAYRYLNSHSDRYGPDALTQATTRRDNILQSLPH